jgi:hypothetical protein
LANLGAGLLSTKGQLDPSKASFGAGLMQGLANMRQAEQLRMQKTQQQWQQQYQAEQLRQQQEAQDLQKQIHLWEKNKFGIAQDFKKQQREMALKFAESLKTPEQRQQGALLAAGGANSLDIAKYMQAGEPKPAGGLFAQWQAARAAGDPDAQRMTFTQWANTRSKAGASNINIPGTQETWKGSSPQGRKLADLMQMLNIWKDRDSMPPYAKNLYDALNASLVAESQPGGEAMANTKFRLNTAGIMMGDFLEVMQDPNVRARSGALQGYITQLLNKPNMVAAIAKELVGQHPMVSMAVQLGSSIEALVATAITGAAMPESERPMYQAMIPRITDTPEQAMAKAFGFSRMLAALDYAKELHAQNKPVNFEYIHQLAGVDKYRGTPMPDLLKERGVTNGLGAPGIPNPDDLPEDWTPEQVNEFYGNLAKLGLLGAAKRMGQ